MKAWILEKQSDIEEKPLKLEEVPDPKPKRNEIKINVRACGICRTDIHIAEGDLPLKKSPIILGHEIVGVVNEVGRKVNKFRAGDRAGVAWLNSTCGKCKFCKSDRENLCRDAKFTGWNADGGFAEYTKISQDFAFSLENEAPFHEIAPWMCPGIAGYRSLRLSKAEKGDKLGLYGFGSTASYVLQVAKHIGVEVYVITRSEKNKKAARRLEADWVGGYEDSIPSKLDAGIVFPPAGNLVEFALGQLDRGGRIVLAPVTMDKIEIKDYNNIWMEREIKSLANISRKDCQEFLGIADEIEPETRNEVYSFKELPDAMISVKKGEVDGNAVIAME